MIELIFAIVIMAIILGSAPQLISTSAKSNYVGIQQEAINEAATQANIIMGYHWDENAANEQYLDPILRVGSTNVDLAEAVPTGRRLGTPRESTRTFIRSDGARNLAATATLGMDGVGEIRDDMDDFIGTSNLISLGTGSGANYIETTVNMNTAIAYGSDDLNYNQSTITFNPFVSTTGTSNIKSITVTVRESASTIADELKKEITLRAFSCNIGTYKLEEGSF
jgi:hypothetical protein